MIVLHEVADVTRPVGEVFDYVSDFTTATEWDSTATSSVKLTAGPIAVGTRFEVICALPIGSIKILYTVMQLETDKLFVLEGNCRFFHARDTIEFAQSPLGTKIDYRAEFTFTPMVDKLAIRAREGLENMGRESVAGLAAALEDNFALEPTSNSTKRADQLVLPGLAMFTRLGYKLGRKHFKPMSASVRGKHMVVTGANAGLGYATALELARRGAELTLVIRDEAKAADTLQKLEAETGNANIRCEMADLSLMADVDSLVERLNDQARPIDVLINNAGALFNPRAETSEGLERSYALLLLAPYRLTEGLKPLLAKADTARVINVVSGGMYSQKLNVAALCNDDGPNYSGSVAYAREKRALMVMTEEWAKNWSDEGIVVNAMHPGWADTPGVQTALPAFRRFTKSVLRSAQEGADTIVWLAVASEAGEVSGKLFLDRQVRTTHLQNKTRETTAERQKLFDFLSEASAALDSEG